MPLEFREWHPRLHRNAVVYVVEIVLTEVDNATTVPILDVGIANVPLLGNGPVEDLRSRRDLVDLQRDPLGDPAQGLADTLAGDAPADGEQLLHETEHPGSDLIVIEPQVR